METNLTKELQREKNNLFSFYLISGDREKNKKDILEFLEKELKFPITGNMDFFNFSGEKFLIDQTREIKDIDSKSKAGGKYRIFILSFENISVETQNALLKVLEEPAEGTIFFFLVSNLDHILDTVKSRARIIETELGKANQIVQDYLLANFTEREKIIADLDKNLFSVFFYSLEEFLLKNREKITDFKDFYQKFLDLKKYVGQKGVSYKYIFTYLNLVIPEIK